MLSMYKTGFVLIFFVFHFHHVIGQTFAVEFKNKSHIVKEKIAIPAYHFSPERIKLFPGSMFYEARQKDSSFLALLSPARLLSRHFKNAGLHPLDREYGGWESEGLSGHTLGHYISALALMSVNTGSQMLKHKLDTILHQLNYLQVKRGTGYIGAIPNEDSIFIKVKQGRIKSSGFDLNGGWSPWYTVHKLMAGLVDAYTISHQKIALDIVTRMADWTDDIMKDLPDSTRLAMLRCEYGGMNDVLANLYALTGNKKYLDLSYKFYDDFVMQKLADSIDPLPGKHSNTNVPKAIGSARQYELTKNDRDRKIAINFWNFMTQHHTYVIGGNSNYEYCGEEDKLNDRLSDNTCETCNTYNMLKLTRHLYSWSGDSKYIDYYEKALYNHILASQNHENGMMCYFVPLRTGSKKQFSDTFQTFTCCVGSGMENHSKYNEEIYTHDGHSRLYVNLFIPSSVDWKESGLKLKQETKFPYENTTRLIIEHTPFAHISQSSIAIRIPGWCKTEPGFKINDKTEWPVAVHRGYAIFIKNWHAGDHIDVTFPMQVYSESMPDNKDRFAFKYGPIVLAADLGNHPVQELDYPVVHGTGEYISSLMSSNDLSFSLDQEVSPGKIHLKPFFNIQNEYYGVYLDHLDRQAYLQRNNRIRQEQELNTALELATLDKIDFSDRKNVQEHDLHFTERSYTSDALGKYGREARADHSFEYSLYNRGDQPKQLVMTYYGDDKDRTFTILVDDLLLTETTLNPTEANKFYNIAYDIPITMTQGKSKITIKILANKGKTAGRVFVSRIVNR